MSTLKTYRVSFSDTRLYYHDVQAADADAAFAAATLLNNSDEGTEHKNGSEYAVWYSTDEVQP